MPKLMDYMISPLPIRIVDLNIDKATLKIKNLIITQIGHLPGRTLRRARVMFDSWAVIYIVGGKGSFQINDEDIHIVEKGAIFFVWPGATFTFGPTKGDYWDEYYIRFEGSRLTEWLNSGLIHPNSVANIGVHGSLVNKIETIFALMECGIPANADRAALLLESLIYEFAQESDNRLGDRAPQLALALLEDLAESLYHPLQAEQIACRHHISISSLRRIVKKSTGYSLNEYVHRLKVAEAKKLLLNTELTVKEMSMMLGFDDPLYFSRLFKKFSGTSATHFRTSV